VSLFRAQFIFPPLGKRCNPYITVTQVIISLPTGVGSLPPLSLPSGVSSEVETSIDLDDYAALRIVYTAESYAVSPARRD